jgi:antitoxin component YwqK of YwqJK toxin-antitoxin module
MMKKSKLMAMGLSLVGFPVLASASGGAQRALFCRFSVSISQPARRIAMKQSISQPAGMLVMKQSISLAALLTLTFSSISLAHNGVHDHGHEGDERAHLMREVGKVSEVTDVSELEVRDDLAWLDDAQEPYSGWVKNTWGGRHNHWPHGWHTHPARTRMVKFKGGVPIESRWLDQHFTLQSLDIFAEKDQQLSKTWAASFLTGFVTNKELYPIVHEKRLITVITKYIEWHENGTRKREAQVLECTQDGYRKEEFTEWRRNGLVSEQGQVWRKENFRKGDGKVVSFYSNGQKRSEELWDDGKLVTMQVWKIDGEKCPETSLAEGTGRYAWYDQNGGEKYAVHRYMNGLLHGPSITYHKGGKTSEQNWVKGERQGTGIQYKDDGSRIEITYGGEQDGLQVHYNADGSVSKTLTRAEYQQQITDRTEEKYGKFTERDRAVITDRGEE